MTLLCERNLSISHEKWCEGFNGGITNIENCRQILQREREDDHLHS